MALPTVRARHVMQGMLALFQETNYMVWVGNVGPLMAFVLQEYQSRWNPAHVAILLSAFSAGYVPTQVPYSLLARRTGEKLLCTVNLSAQAVGCALLPAAAASGPLALSAVHAGLGVFQGSRIPCSAVLSQRWIPDGMERILNQQVTGWFAQIYSLLINALVPVLAMRYGWRVVPRWFAVQSALMAVLWQLVAVDTPAQWRGPVKMEQAELELLANIGQERGGEGEKQKEPATDTTATIAATGTSAAMNSDSGNAPKLNQEQERRRGTEQELAAVPAAALRDKDLPPLSVGQLVRIRKIQGMMALSVVTALFPPAPAGALSTLYFADRYATTPLHVLYALHVPFLLLRIVVPHTRSSTNSTQSRSAIIASMYPTHTYILLVLYVPLCCEQEWCTPILCTSAGTTWKWRLSSC